MNVTTLRLLPAPPGERAPDPETPPNARPQPRRLLVTALAALAAVLVLAALYLKVAWSTPVNSDHASIILEAEAALHGNPLLRGWTLTNVGFYTTELPWYVLGLALRRPMPSLLHEVPALVYALLTVCAAGLAGRGEGRRFAPFGMALAFLLLGLPAQGVPIVVLVGVDHITTAWLMVLGLLAIDCASDKKPLASARLLALSVLLALDVAGDTTALLTFALPLLAMGALRLKAAPEHADREKPLLLAVLGGTLAGTTFNPMMHALGGYAIMPLRPVFTSLQDFPQNALSLAGSLLTFCRADFFGQRVSPTSLAQMAALIGVAALLGSFACALRRARTCPLALDRVNLALCLSMLFNALGYLVNAATVDVSNTLNSPVERYLVSFFVCGAVLAGRLGVEQWGAHPRFRQGLALLGAAYGLFFVQQLCRPPMRLPAAALGQWLQANHLTSGYGNFWCSSIVTAQTGGRVQVRAVQALYGPVEPFHWFSDKNWYVQPAKFLVYDLTRYKDTDFAWFNLETRTATATFGPPARIAQVGQYTVLIWNHDIHAQLADLPPPQERDAL